MTRNEMLEIHYKILKVKSVDCFYGPNFLDSRAFCNYLKALKIDDVEAFINRYNFSMKEDIYLCFRPGSANFQFENQIAAVLYQVKHVDQYRANSFMHHIEYLNSRKYRMDMELESIIEHAKALWIMTKQMPSLKFYCNLLSVYKLSRVDIKKAQPVLSAYLDFIKQAENKVFWWSDKTERV